MNKLNRALVLLGMAFVLQLAGCAATPPNFNLSEKNVATPTPLMQASAQGKLDRVEALLAKGAPVNAVSHRGSALTLAVAHQQDAVALRLLGDGAKPDLTGQNGVTALMLAAAQGNARLVRVLLARGADVNRRDTRGANAVAYAAREGNLAIIRHLLAAGGNVNITIDGRSLLMQMVDANSLLMTQVLINAGADVNFRADDGETALSIARRHHNRDIQMLLLQAGAQAS